MDMDLLISGGSVVDGTGKPPRRADVAVQDGRILDVGTIVKPEEVPCLDASGLLVAPGFIDIHSHSDFTLIVDPRAVSSITQGVTFEVVGNCGHGCAPIVDAELAKSNIYGSRADSQIDWHTMAEYLDRLQAGRPAVNVAALVPNGILRLAAVEHLDRPSTPEELERMKRLLAQGLEEGAIGFSTGLEYGPEMACPEEEIVELCRVAAQAGGLYATHTRNRYGEAHEAIAEAIRTSTASGAPLQISHIQVVARLGENGREALEHALQQVEQARDQGVDIGFDMHTRLFGTTHLSTALPPWAVVGGKAAIAARLRDRGVREELKSYRSHLRSLVQDDWNKIILFDSKAAPGFSRRSIAEIAGLTGADPLEAICDLLLAEIDDMHSPMVIALTYREEENRIAFEHRHCMVASDATALATDGPLQGTSFHGAYTWASWFFRHFVRDTAAFSPQEAVRRLTSLPAQRLGVSDRGVIRKGAWADLAVFDPRTFGERGTTYEPNRTATGMKHVLVNGTVTVENGELTGLRGGQVVRSGQVSPSRVWS